MPPQNSTSGGKCPHRPHGSYAYAYYYAAQLYIGPELYNDQSDLEEQSVEGDLAS